jgi:hypothetical protein
VEFAVAEIGLCTASIILPKQVLGAGNFKLLVIQNVELPISSGQILRTDTQQNPIVVQLHAVQFRTVIQKSQEQIRVEGIVA